MNIAEKVSLVIIIICAVVIFGGRDYSEFIQAVSVAGLFSFLFVFLAAGLLKEDETP